MNLLRIETLVVAVVAFAAAATSPRDATAGNSALKTMSVTSAAAAGKSLLIVGDGTSGTSVIFDAKLQRVGRISAPIGDFGVDEHGNFYDVPYIGLLDRVLEFAPPNRGQPRIIRFGKDSTVALGVDAINGVFAVGVEQFADGGPGPYYVYFFRPGMTKPCAKIGSPNVAGIGFKMSFDRKHDLFLVAALPNGSTTVASITGECAATSITIDALPPNVTYPSKLAFNSDDQLVLQDGGTNAILTFALPKNERFSQPLATTVLNVPDPKYTVPFFECLSADGQHLWANYETNGQSSKTLSEFDYPAGGSPVANIQLKDAFACTTAPAIVP